MDRHGIPIKEVEPNVWKVITSGYSFFGEPEVGFLVHVIALSAFEAL